MSKRKRSAQYPHDNHDLFEWINTQNSTNKLESRISNTDVNSNVISFTSVRKQRRGEKESELEARALTSILNRARKLTW